MLPARIASAPFALFFLLLFSLPARAQDDVQALVERGTAALRADRGAEARAAFTEGLTLATTATDRWRMHLGLALSLELTDELADAAYAYRTFLRASAGHPDAQSPKWQERRRRAKSDLARLEDRILVDHAKVDLQTDPPGAQVSLDGEPFEHRTPVIVYVLPGPHRLELAKGGHETISISLVLEQGQEPLIHRRLPPSSSTGPSEPPSPRPAPTAPPSTPPSQEETPTSLVIPAAVVAATGGAALLSAGLLHGMALRDANEVRTLSEGPITEGAIARDNQLRGRIATYQRGYASLYVIGGAAALTAATLLVYELVADDVSTEGAQVGPWAGPDGGGLAIGSAF